MENTCNHAEQLLNSIFDSAGFDLHASVSDSEVSCLLAIEGADSALLLNQGGELLDALQQILNQAYGRDLPKGRGLIGAGNNNAPAGESDLREMAEHAARKGASTSAAFVFGPMEASDRGG